MNQGSSAFFWYRSVSQRRIHPHKETYYQNRPSWACRLYKLLFLLRSKFSLVASSWNLTGLLSLYSKAWPIAFLEIFSCEGMPPPLLYTSLLICSALNPDELPIATAHCNSVTIDDFRITDFVSKLEIWPQQKLVHLFCCFILRVFWEVTIWTWSKFLLLGHDGPLNSSDSVQLFLLGSLGMCFFCHYSSLFIWMKAVTCFSSLNSTSVSIYYWHVLQHFYCVLFVCLSEEDFTIFNIYDKNKAILPVLLWVQCRWSADTPGLSTGPGIKPVFL